MGVDYFISRAGADAEWAQWIASCLRGGGYSVVLQDWDFSPGQDFVAQMDRAMREADRTIAVLSRSYDLARYTSPEWRSAFARDPTGSAARLVPVRVDDVQIEGVFSTTIYIDLYGLDKERAREKLLDGVRRVAAVPLEAARFPGAVTTRLPGALPPTWRLPSERNPVFVGREVEMGAIRARFESSDPPPLAAAVVGLGAVGKTALAVEYAHRFRDLYKTAWWIRAGRQETAAADMALLAESLGLAGADDPLTVRAAAARDWLASHDRWLLLLDDAADPSVLRRTVPQGGGGHVLVTSRSPAWRRHATVIELAPLAEKHAVDLLARRSGQARDDASAVLVRALGGLPLAVELAGAFLEQQGVGAAEYMRRLRKNGGLPVDSRAERPPDYDVALRVVWDESFRVLVAQTPLARDLLRLAAFLAPEDIPRPALVRGAHRLPPALGAAAADPDALADLVARPRAFSLVTTSGDGFSIHRMVQAVVRDRLEKQDRASWAGAAVLLLVHVLPRQVGDYRLWDKTGRLIGHALAASEHGVAESVEPAATTHLLDRATTYLAETGGDAAEVEAGRLAALRLAEAMPDGPPGWLLNNHALWLLERGANDDAEKMFERALSTTRRVEGGDAPAVAVNWVNLGSLAKTRGDLPRARACFERALAIMDRLPSWAEERRATAHSLLGQVLLEQGEREGAAANFEAAVRGYDAALGTGSQDSVLARTFLAQARGEDPRIVTTQVITRSFIDAERGRVLAQEPAWRDEAETLLRSAHEAGEPGAAVELAALLRRVPATKREGDAVLAEAAADGDREALYWHARERAQADGAAAEPLIRRSIEAGNAFSWYDLGLVLTGDADRRVEAEAAFRAALAGGFETARNDLALLLVEWPGREREGEAMFAEGGRRGQARCWFNLGQFLSNQPGRDEDAVGALRLAANAGYLRAHGTLAYRLEDLGRLDESLAAFNAGVEAGDAKLVPHLTQFLGRHPEMAAPGRAGSGSRS